MAPERSGWTLTRYVGVSLVVLVSNGFDAVSTKLRNGLMYLLLLRLHFSPISIDQRNFQCQLQAEHPQAREGWFRHPQTHEGAQYARITFERLTDCVHRFTRALALVENKRPSALEGTRATVSAVVLARLGYLPRFCGCDVTECFVDS